MSERSEDELVRDAAKYLLQQHGNEAVSEALIGKRHAELIGDQSTVEAFELIIDYLKVDLNF